MRHSNANSTRKPLRSCEASGKSYPGPLLEGIHTFQVRATDGNGTGPAASATWTIDLTPPTTTIDTKPADRSPGASAAFKFHASEALTFQCSLEGPVTKPLTACSSPKTYTALSDGEYTFKVQATDQAGNVQAIPTSYSWTVKNSVPDTTPPLTSITSHPPDPSESPRRRLPMNRTSRDQPSNAGSMAAPSSPVRRPEPPTMDSCPDPIRLRCRRKTQVVRGPIAAGFSFTGWILGRTKDRPQSPLTRRSRRNRRPRPTTARRRSSSRRRRRRKLPVQAGRQAVQAVPVAVDDKDPLLRQAHAQDQSQCRRHRRSEPGHGQLQGG